MKLMIFDASKCNLFDSLFLNNGAETYKGVFKIGICCNFLEVHSLTHPPCLS